VAPQTLSTRALNRATLDRQLLLAREDVPVVEALERLGGLQAQEPRPPFVALWSRLEGFDPAQLQVALHERRAVRATMMRATLHLVSASDYAALRPALAPALEAAMRSVLRQRKAEDLDEDAVVAAAQRLAAERPRTFSELRPLLAEAFPHVDERSLGYAVRMLVPLVMVPTDDAWAFPSDAQFAPAIDWLGRARLDGPEPRALVIRHLAAFGPSAATDVQAWSGVKGLREVLEELAPGLAVFRDERGRTLYDLPRAPRPDPETPAPVRFLPDFDSLLLAHDDRSRIVAGEHRAGLVTKNLRVRATFLVDGFVAGTWTVKRTKRKATLTAAAFGRLPGAAKRELEAEAEALLAFTEGPDVAADVAFA
jgi:hypothetical protein